MTQSKGKKKALVVEDEAGISALCCRVLSAEGFAVDVAVNGKVGLEMVEETSKLLARGAHSGVEECSSQQRV
jgi:CheY-like chemotaxis protein